MPKYWINHLYHLTNQITFIYNHVPSLFQSYSILNKNPIHIFSLFIFNPVINSNINKSNNRLHKSTAKYSIKLFIHIN